MSSINCFHCGNECNKDVIYFRDSPFCCNGCKTVYEILHDNELTTYYDFENAPGAIPKKITDKYNYLDNEKIADSLYDFKDDTTRVITLYIPHIHCSSCIWVLEHLGKLHKGIISSQVNFPKKEVRITFKNEEISLKNCVELLSSIGYEPYISLEDVSVKKRKIDHSLLYKLGVAGFAFGNIMLLSFPEYFKSDGFWLEKYKPLFSTLIFITILPVMFYAASDYFKSAYKGLKHHILNIDVPIALGISVLFLRSTLDFFMNNGQGYFDSLAGFVFFLLLGKVFQQQTYSFLSFERDYKSYFPIAVTKIERNNTETSISVHDIQQGDRLLIRNDELIPVDGILLSNSTKIDYSFVTGESMPATKKSGDKIFAGGRQLQGAIEMDVLHNVSQSYLTQLWSNDVFNKNKQPTIKNLTDSISKQFTLIVLGIAFISGVVWYFIDPSMIANVVSAVLIIACPCALALSAPFALGNMLRILGKRKLYLKNTDVIEQLANANAIIFDKTGTITNNKTTIGYFGEQLQTKERNAVQSMLRASNHPLSRLLYDHLGTYSLKPLEAYSEIPGKGIEGSVDGLQLKIGSAKFVNADEIHSDKTVVYIAINKKIIGHYTFKNSYRKSLESTFYELSKNYELGILSGDNSGEQKQLLTKLPNNTSFVFDQKPEDKLEYIKSLQDAGKKVIMVGDGLNDAGALAQSEVGLVITEDINVFTPASDGILDATQFDKIPMLLALSKKTIKIIKISFVISFIYNFVGMLFAVSGNLSPIVAAILMPLSSISIVIFVTIFTNYIARKKAMSKYDIYHSSPSNIPIDLL